ncbi:metal-dependent hydrolase [Tepidibacillus marianensis]|uniref:metal-dependent hydrolase n=1 Tax=Tepidibacillus marianensis TaxID=3131995 RepID=UPI0030CB2BE2
MDTGTHFVMGVSLAGLAHIDPLVQHQSVLAQAVLIGTLVGSQAPDLDGVTRFFGGTANYIKNHRGISHSLPFLLVWPTIITLILTYFYIDVSFFHLWIWTFIAVFFHVFLDIFNAYGTQAFRPFTEKRIALNVINIFDPFLFSTHIIGILLWVMVMAQPSSIFPIIYFITLLYMGWRTITHHNLIKKIKLDEKVKGKLTILPTIRWSIWNLIEEEPTQFRLGIIRNNHIEWVDQKIKWKTTQVLQRQNRIKRHKTFSILPDMRILHGEKQNMVMKSSGLIYVIVFKIIIHLSPLSY